MTPAEEKAFKAIQESTQRIGAAFNGLIASVKAAAAAWAAIPESAKEQVLRASTPQTVESDSDDNKGGKHD